MSKYTIFVNIFTLSNLCLAPDVPEPILGLVCEDSKSAIIIIAYLFYYLLLFDSL